jgi:hypothetical protein
LPLFINRELIIHAKFIRIKIWTEIGILKYNLIADVTNNLFKNKEIAYKEKYLRNKNL